MLEKLKDLVCQANLALVKYNLVIFTEGNVSAVSEDRKYLAIKPSGVSYEKLTPDKIVIVGFDENVANEKFKPSMDTATHIEIYKRFPEIKAVVHTHSPYATIFAQNKKPIVCFGTTHADNFYGTIPVTREMTKEEIEKNYESNTGKAICEILNIDIPAVLVASHGPFIFGKSLNEAINNAVVLEKVAMMALHNDSTKQVNQYLLDKHYSRKHGKNRYYGQKE
jgi:L-ribulose-5-phosphate 4-epimerase